MKTVLFVCTANICRSPMAEAIFNALAEDRNLPLRAQSAGVAALEGRTMAPNAVAALKEAGIYPGPHGARRVSEEMLEGFDLVLTMTPKHTATVRRLGKDPAAGVYTLQGYASGVPGEGIPDPYGLTMTAYRSTLRQIYEQVEHVVERLGG